MTANIVQTIKEENRIPDEVKFMIGIAQLFKSYLQIFQRKGPWANEYMALSLVWMIYQRIVDKCMQN